MSRSAAEQPPDPTLPPIPYVRSPMQDWSLWTPTDLRPWRARARDRIVRSWPMHNLVAHPLSELLHWAGVIFGGDGDDLGGRLHDATLPSHEPGRGRG